MRELNTQYPATRTGVRSSRVWDNCRNWRELYVGPFDTASRGMAEPFGIPF